MLTEGNRAEERRKWSNDWLKRKNFSLCIIRPHAKFYFTLCVITGKFTFLFVFTPTVKYFIRLVENQVFYPRISQRSLLLEHSTCSENVAMHSMFNIQEFQAAFSTLYCTVGKCILRRCRSDPVMYRTLPAAKMQSCSLCSIYKSFQLLFQRNFEV